MKQSELNLKQERDLRRWMRESHMNDLEKDRIREVYRQKDKQEIQALHYYLINLVQKKNFSKHVRK